jgi:hypothetical protein
MCVCGGFLGFNLGLHAAVYFNDTSGKEKLSGGTCTQLFTFTVTSHSVVLKLHIR